MGFKSEHFGVERLVRLMTNIGLGGVDGQGEHEDYGWWIFGILYKTQHISATAPMYVCNAQTTPTKLPYLYYLFFTRTHCGLQAY